MNLILKTFHLLSIAIWVGTIVYFSFFAAPAVFKSFPKETAGDIISVIITKYYTLSVITGAVAVATAILLGFFASGRQGSDVLRTAIVIVMFVSTLYAGYVLHPQVRSLKSEIRATTIETEKNKLEQAFKSAHLRSVQLNVVSLLGGLVVLVMLASRIKP